MVPRLIISRGTAYLCFLLTLSVMTPDAAVAYQPRATGDKQACCSTGGACMLMDPLLCAAGGGTSFLGATCDGPTACCDDLGLCTDGTNPCHCLLEGGLPTLAECSERMVP